MIVSPTYIHINHTDDRRAAAPARGGVGNREGRIPDQGDDDGQQLPHVSRFMYVCMCVMCVYMCVVGFVGGFIDVSSHPHHITYHPPTQTQQATTNHAYIHICKTRWVDQDVAPEEPRKLHLMGNKQQVEAALRMVSELLRTAPILQV
jgi:hypothetical protein